MIMKLPDTSILISVLNKLYFNILSTAKYWLYFIKYRARDDLPGVSLIFLNVKGETQSFPLGYKIKDIQFVDIFYCYYYY